MSDNLDLVRSIYADWERGDFTGTDWADPEIELAFVDGPDPRTLKGLREMAAGWREFLTTWTGYGVEVDEYRELTDSRVLVILHPIGQGKTSGVQLGQTSGRVANVHEFRGGKMTRLVIYWDRDRAFADLGLEE